MDKSEHKKNNIILELIEQISRIAFAIAICVLVNDSALYYKSITLCISILFLILYYIVWIRYFVHGRDVKMLGKSFIGIPMPLAVFPVLYYLFASIWLSNYIAALIMIIFGIAHNLISYNSLYTKNNNI